MYCSVDDVKNNHDKIPISGEEERIESFILDADAIIDSYLRCRYNVPFIGPPRLILMISRDIATFFELRFLYGSQSRQYLDWVETYWNSSIQLLEKLQKGEIALDKVDFLSAEKGEATSNVNEVWK